MTNRLYYENAYLTEFDAVVLEVRATGRGAELRLDQSAFYPTSGGQPYDTGTLNGLPVREVYVDEGGEVWHLIEGSLTPGQRVRGIIDWARRFDHMQQHGGEHLLAGAVYRLYHGHTIGLHLGAQLSTIDVELPDGAKNITPEQARRLEDLVNGQIQRDAPIRCWFPKPEELAKLPLRKPPTVDHHVRIVAMGDFECVACGGTHPSSTGQIGLLKLVDHRPSKGKVRLSFVCGGRAVRDYQARARAVDRAAALLSTGVEQLPEAVERLLSQVKELEATMSRERRQALIGRVPQLLDEAQVLPGGGRVVARCLPGADAEGLRALAARLIEQPDTVALLGGGQAEGPVQLVFARSAGLTASMGALMSEAARLAGGKGGGRPDFAQGSAPDARAIELALSLLCQRAVQ